MPPMSSSLAIASEVVEVPRRPLPDAAELAIQAAALQHEIRDAPDDGARREAIAAYRRVADPCAWPAWGRGRCAWRCRRCAWERP